MKIMVIEDDSTIALSLANEFESWGYETYTVTDFTTVKDQFIKEHPALVLLDLVLPLHNGYYWCEQIREISQVPIIFISSKSEQMDQILAIQYGADDYITKPLDINLTLAKIRALLRRTYDFTADLDVLYFSNCQLHTREAKLIYEDSVVQLTHTELLLMEALFKAKGNFVSRENLLEACWDSDSFIDDNTLAVNITRLRKKLREVDLDNFIVTKKGMGYALAEVE